MTGIRMHVLLDAEKYQLSRRIDHIVSYCLHFFVELFVFLLTLAFSSEECLIKLGCSQTDRELDSVFTK